MNEPSDPITPQPIKTLPELIGRLQAIRTDLDARHLTLRQYEHVGWAARPIESLLDRCREEAESSNSAERRVLLYRSLWPHLVSGAVLRPTGPSSSEPREARVMNRVANGAGT